MTTQLHFKKALLPGGWADDVLISIERRQICGITTDTPVSSETECIKGFTIPGMTNVHSHAFQYAFAGLSEYRSTGNDSFWTWRKLMYEFLDRLTPEDVFEIGRRLYAEMLKAGYSTVGEFHYLLHQPDGTPYQNVNEMADALIEAAIETGINICILPAYYQRGGFDDSPLEGGQRRFGTSRELYLKMLEKLQHDWGDHPQVRLGIALHSLRAVSVSAAQAIVEDVDRILGGCPIHIHVAEQIQEVEDCLAATGRRPVEILLDSFEVNERWCLIHATHMTVEECQRVAASGAVVGVCPTTEANLGDGVFMAERYLRQGGRLAVGSDSHVSVDPWEELRLLEYAQRLAKRRRAILCSDEQSCGELLFDWASRGGAQLTGFGPAGLQIGAPANFFGLDLVDEESLNQLPTERILDWMVFTSCALAKSKLTAVDFD